MKQFLLFVSLAGAALYALLVYSHHTITEGRSERVPARQTQPNDPSAQRLSSWESHIRSSAPNSQPTAHLPSQQDAADELRRDPSQDSERKPGGWYQGTTSEAKSAVSNPAQVGWAKVVFAARMHDQASVSSFTVRTLFSWHRFAGGQTRRRLAPGIRSSESAARLDP